MRIISAALLFIAALTFFGGCSAQQFNETTEDLTGQLSEIGEEATEKRE